MIDRQCSLGMKKVKQFNIHATSVINSLSYTVTCLLDIIKHGDLSKLSYKIGNIRINFSYHGDYVPLLQPYHLLYTPSKYLCGFIEIKVVKVTLSETIQLADFQYLALNNVIPIAISEIVYMLASGKSIQYSLYDILKTFVGIDDVLDNCILDILTRELFADEYELDILSNPTEIKIYFANHLHNYIDYFIRKIADRNLGINTIKSSLTKEETHFIHTIYRKYKPHMPDNSIKEIIKNLHLYFKVIYVDGVPLYYVDKFERFIVVDSKYREKLPDVNSVNIAFKNLNVINSYLGGMYD